VLFVDLPAGQVSWHLPKEEVVGTWSQYDGQWDGHDPDEKRARLERFLHTNGVEWMDEVWLEHFDDRQIMLIRNCLQYSRTPGGLPGHHLMLVVARMAELLNLYEKRLSLTMQELEDGDG